VKHLLSDPPAHFSKMPLVESLLPLHDWIVWIDADALIMNFRTRIEDYLDDEYSLIIGDDWNGINTGVFFLRRTAWSLSLVKRVKSAARDNLVFYEQDQLARILKHDRDAAHEVNVIRLKQSGGRGDFNCYPTENRDFPRHETFEYFDHGDFIVHFPGSLCFGDKHRQFLTDLIRSYAKEVIV
jgi:hypothetical protein